LDNLVLKVEALIFASAHAIKVDELKNSVESHTQIAISESEIITAIESLTSKYASDEYSFQLKSVANGYTFMTKLEFHPLVVTHLKGESKTRLTKAAIETLSIIAYKQPVTRTEVENIRGVNCEYSLHKLLEKDLVEITGRDNGPGRPLIYQTTTRFMDYFGISSLSDLPKMKEIRSSDNQMGEQAPIVELVEEESLTNTEI
jgi:segregation and condensation protein B